uniref:Calponin-homology (CH) domain-containing protein n=1 Tax=Loa loa TaxID=7209 RepID=A0A1I7VF35_LOALO
MSDTIIKSAQPAKRELENLLDEAKAMVLTPPDQHLSVEEKEQQFKLKASITLCWYTRINQRKMVGTVNLPQLPLPTFNGDPKIWREEFWGSFNAAVHLRKIPDVQKLNYLISCLKENALQAVKGYDIAQKSTTLSGALVEKFGNFIYYKKVAVK